MTGIVKGYDFKKNKDSANVALMLICEISGQKDTQSIEYMSNPYDNFIPEIDSIVLIVQITKSWKVAIANYGGVDFDNTLNDGERKLSAPNGAYIKLKDDGTIELNGNLNSAVSYSALNTALQLLVTAINANLALKLDGAGAPGTTSLDISAAEVQEVKLS